MQSLLTELEGAVLSEIHHRGASTAFKVRKAFQDSPSVEWSGSSGAVYPAIRRLTQAGLIRTEPLPQARKVERLSLTEAGVVALNAWIVNPVRTASVGLDPFRLRAGLWDFLPAAARREGLEQAQAAIEADLAHLKTYLQGLDAVEQRRVELSIVLQETRLAWLRAEI